MRISIVIVLLCCIYASFAHAQTSLQAQTAPKWNSCPAIAELLADISTDPLDEQRRFELRQCNGDLMIVTAYEKGKTSPSLIFETGDSYPRYLAHVFNVLVFQSIGGASDHVYVFAFSKGKPSLALHTATKDLIQVTQSNKSITVIVPPTTYPGENGKFPPTPPPKKYTFTLEY